MAPVDGKWGVAPTGLALRAIEKTWNRFAYRLIYGGGKWADGGESWRFGWQGEGRADAMDAMEAGCQPWPHPRFDSITFSSSSFSPSPSTSDNGFSSSIQISGIPEFIPEVCVEGTTIPTTWLLLFSPRFFFFGKIGVGSLEKEMRIGNEGNVMKTEPKGNVQQQHQKGLAIFSLAYTNLNWHEICYHSSNVLLELCTENYQLASHSLKFGEIWYYKL